MESDRNSTPPPPLWPFLLLCAATAAWIDFGTVHRQHHADSIIPILTSLYHWTPYYWGTNRNGNLVPLLAIPFKHPLVNLLVQDWFVIFSGLTTLFLLPRYVLRDKRWPYVAIFSAATFLVFAPERYRFSFLVDQPYAVSLALGLGALVLVERPREGNYMFIRSLLSLLLICLAHWVNVGIGSLLGTLVIIRALLDGAAAGKPWFARLDDEATHTLMLLAIGFCLGLMGMQLAHYHETAEGIRAPKQWLEGWSRLVSNTWTALAPSGWPIYLTMMAAGGIFLSLSIQFLRKDALISFQGSAVLVLTAILYGTFIGTLEWVERGGFMERYTIPCVLFIHVGLSVLAVFPLCFLPEGKPSKWFYAAMPIVLLAASFRYGYPSLSGVRNDLEVRLGARTADVLDGQCTHVAGNYWVVWPTVFHANLVRYQRGESEIIWGVSFRSNPLRERIKRVSGQRARIAVPHGDKEAAALLQEYGFAPFALAEKRRTLTVFKPLVGVSGVDGGADNSTLADGSLDAGSERHDDGGYR